MAAALHFLSLIPRALSLHHPASSAPIFTVKPLSKAILPLSSAQPISMFVRNVAVSSELGEALFEERDERSFSPALKLFVGNLSFNVDSAALANLFGRAGNVEMVEVIYDQNSGKSRGFGFVTMSTINEVEAAAQQFNGYEFQGRALRVNAGPPPSKRENSPFRGGSRGGESSDNSNRVYVGNLAWGVDNLTLETLFNEIGKVKEARVVYDRESGRSKGFGFVTFGSADEVNNAIESLDGVDLNGRSIRVSPAESPRTRGQY